MSSIQSTSSSTSSNGIKRQDSNISIYSIQDPENPSFEDTEENEETQYLLHPEGSPNCCSHFTGFILCVLGSMTMSLIALFVTLLPDYDPGNLATWRYVGNTIPSIPILMYYVYWKKQNVFKTVWPLFGKKYKVERCNFIGLVARGFFGGAVTILRFCALRYLSLADVSVITRSTPAIVIILAYFCLNEKCSVVSILAAFLAISGVFILSRPPIITGATHFDKDTLIGLSLSVGALFSSSITIIITRKLHKLNFALLIFAFGIIGIIEGLMLSYYSGTFKFPEGARDISLTVLLSGLTFVGQYFAVLAVKFDGAGPISIVKTSYVPFAFVWQIIFLHIYPDSISILGAGIILAGIFLIALRKWITSMPEDTRIRTIFNCLTM